MQLLKKESRPHAAGIHKWDFSKLSLSHGVMDPEEGNSLRLSLRDI